MRKVFRTSDVMAEVEGDQRVRVSKVFVPSDREGLYKDESEELKFANVKVLLDEDPYIKGCSNVRANLLCSRKFQYDSQDCIDHFKQ